MLPIPILLKANLGELGLVCVWKSVANGLFVLLIISIGTVARSVLRQPGDGSCDLLIKSTANRPMENSVERSRPNGIGSISKTERLLRLGRNKRIRLRPSSPTHRARAIRKRLLKKILVAIGRVVIDASHLRLSRRSKNSVVLDAARLYVA